MRIYYRKDSEIIKALSYVFILIGLPDKEIPNGENLDILTAYIKTAYPNQTLDHIKDAFEGAMANRFLIDEKKPINDLSLYGKIFSAEYFSRVMNAYMEYLRRLPKPYIPPDKQLASENKDQRTPEQKEDAWLKSHEDTTIQMRKVPDKHIIVVEECYRALIRQNLIEVTEEKMALIREVVKSELAAENNMTAAQLSDIELIGNRPQHNIEYLIKRKFIIQHLTTKLIENESK
jgi:hypothetical protein